MDGESAWSPTPVIVVENGERWLVAPYGEVSWVRNARAAGQATLSRGRRREEIKLSEVGPQESAPVLREYLRQAKAVRSSFDASRESPLDAFVAKVPHRVSVITSHARRSARILASRGTADKARRRW